MSLMIMREKRDINPVLLKIGIISAFSLIGGIFYSIFKSRRTNNPSGSSSAKAQSSPEYQSDQSDSAMAKDDLRSPDDDFLQKTFDFGNSDLIVPVEDESPSHSRGSVGSFTSSNPPSNESTCDKNVYLLPELNDFFKEHDLAVIKDSSTTTFMENAEMPNHEVEIMGLRSTIKTLNERIRSLELELLEYHGIKEQESYVMELKNRLKINHMEVKILHLKIKALMADKKRLEEQMADYSKVTLELETAKSKINVLEKELSKEAQQNKGYLLALRDRVEKLQDDELKAFSNSEVQLMLQKTKDLTEEIEELKKTNHSLEEENSALSHKVEYLQNFVTSALEDEQVEALKKESTHLRQQNEELVSQIERLEAAQCTDVEELVYLRWINACLRYELRNHTPDRTGKTAARDLSRSLSPKSEEKAKQLILEYAQKEEGFKKDKATISIADFDLEQWSSSHSYLTEDSDEGDDYSSLDFSSTNYQSDITRHSKIFGKLMRLIRGQRQHSSSLETNLCIDSKVRRCSSDIQKCNSGVVNNIRSRTSSLEKPNKLSLDLEKIAHFRFQESRSPKGEEKSNNYVVEQRCQRNSHDGSSYIYRVVGTISSHEDDQHNLQVEDGSKAELVKYAEALKGSSNQKTLGRRRAASCSSFKHL